MIRTLFISRNRERRAQSERRLERRPRAIEQPQEEDDYPEDNEDDVREEEMFEDEYIPQDEPEMEMPEEDEQETVETVSEPKANRTVPPTTFVTGRTSRISGMEGPKDRSSF